jgi:transcriptional regulator with XRE-family HTH domain
VPFAVICQDFGMSVNERFWRKDVRVEPSTEPDQSAVNAGAAATAAKGREEFAARLRELRVLAGSPPFRRLAKLTNYSPSTLADATSGRRLPTEPVLKALVSACGADPVPWLDDLRQLTADQAQPAAVPEPPEDARKRRTGRWPAAAAATAGGLVVFCAGIAAGLALAPASSSPDPQEAGPGVPAFAGTPTPAPTSRVTDGFDPGAGHCEADARLVDRAPVMRGTVQIGALDLLYSPWCGAGWAMIYLYPGEPTMMGEVTVRAADGRYMTIANPLVKQVDDYTDVIVPGRGGCLGAYGQVYQQGMPLITVSLPCEAPTSSPAHPAL